MARVLIVDDENSVRVTLQQFLVAEGHAVDIAPDAGEAQRLLAGQNY